MMQEHNENQSINAYITVEKGHLEKTLQLFTLSHGVTSIGRPTLDHKPDIELSDPQISRDHAGITFRDGTFWLQDRGSTNGTTLNGNLLKKDEEYPLTDNSIIGIAILKGLPRVELLFRQPKDNIAVPLTQAIPVCPWLSIDDGKKEVLVDDRPVSLPLKEYNLLLFLYRKAGNVCSRDEIIEAVWSDVQDPGAVSDATIDQLVHRLREKVEKVPSKPARIVSKKGFGYLLV
jgi:pSer/pThr/pTyr-binding forkhead associated (FHA) protein